MATSENQQVSTPNIKFEGSPAESFLSQPGDMYPSLFEATTPSCDPTMDPMESVMTPTSTADGRAETPCADGSDKKQPKKRKSWGQVLPEPKTNLPPRKRAKTEDEKEQRRVERVLRNRRAAQSSRERKRQEVEALEARLKEFETQLLNKDKTIELLMDEMNKMKGGAGRSVSPLESLQPSPLTLSQSLFGEAENGDSSNENAGIMEDFISMPENNGTVNPASLSPELTPVPDNSESNSSAPKASTPAAPAPAEPSSDMTQHSAAVLCGLQCLPVEVPLESKGSRPTVTPAPYPFQQLPALLMAYSVMISTCHRPLTLIAGALKNNLALPPTPSILSTIIWLVTRPPNFTRSSTLTSSSATTTTQSREARLPETTGSPWNPTQSLASSTLRIKSLQKLLTCSPILARPLMDATMGLLRLVSEERDDRVEELAGGVQDNQGNPSRGPRTTWPDGSCLPSREVLITLLWAMRVQEGKLSNSEETVNSTVISPTSQPGSSASSTDTTDQKFVLSGKRQATSSPVVRF